MQLLLDNLPVLILSFSDILRLLASEISLKLLLLSNKWGTFSSYHDIIYKSSDYTNNCPVLPCEGNKNIIMWKSCYVDHSLSVKGRGNFLGEPCNAVLYLKGAFRNAGQEHFTSWKGLVVVGQGGMALNLKGLDFD